MLFRVPLITFAIIVVVAACSKRDPIADNATGSSLPAPPKDTTPKPAGLPPENAAAPASGTAPVAAAVIPADLQGRWGLTPADCIATRSDSKGLLVMTTDQLTFYESRAVPSADVTRDGPTLSGDFNFTGEGKAWSKFEALKRKGDKLTRTETNPAASYTYAKC